MRIINLELRHFRCFHEAKIEGLGPLNFFGGRNGAGKSTILDAISFGLTGTCRGAETGKALDELRTQSDGNVVKHRAFVGFHFTHGKEDAYIQRKDDEGPRAAVQKELDKLLGIPSSTVRACLYAGELLRIPRKDAQALVMDLLPSQLVEIPKNISTIVGELLDYPELKSATLKDLDKLHEDAYGRRREAGRVLKALGDVGPAPKPPEWLKEGDDPTVVRKTIYGKLLDLRRERDGALTAAQQSLGAKERAEEKLQQALDTLKEVQGEIDIATTPDTIRDEARKLLAAKSEREETNTAIEAALSRMRRDLATHEGTRNGKQAALDAYRKLEGDCPTCLRKLTPAAKRTMEESLISGIEAASREAQTVRVQLEAQEKSPPKSLADIERKIVDLTAAEHRWVKLKERREQLEITIEKAKRAVVDVKPTMGANTEEMDKRISGGEEKLAELDRYIPVYAQWNRSAIEAQTLKKEHDGLETLLEAFGPNGLRLELTAGKGLDDFQAGIADTMKQMGFGVDLGPLLRLTDDPHVNGRPARFLSASESLRFSLAFAIAVARWSQLGIVCVDAWDSLDEYSTKDAAEVLNAADDLQRFVFVTPKKGMAAFKAASLGVNSGGQALFYVVERTTEGSVVELPGSTMRP